MSLVVPIDSLSQEIREKVARELSIALEKPGKPKKFKAKAGSQYTDVFEVENDDLILPLSYGINELHMAKPKSSSYSCINPEAIFTGSLREEQKGIKDEAIANLNTHGACLISAYPGFGKTCTSIYISSKIKLKTLIILNRLVLMNQWFHAINKFCPNAKVTCLETESKSKLKLKSKSKLKSGSESDSVDTEYDYLIVNAINICKFGRSFFKSVGTVIVDEAHLIMSKVLSQSLFYVHPKYVIGLSATPYRPDGMDALMTLFFTDKKIIRKLWKEHLVYKITTGFTPEVEYDASGSIVWGSILEQQCSNPQRNQIIIDVVLKHKDRVFLILSKRVDQAQYLHDQLKILGEKITLFIGSATTFDKDARIIVGTTSKLGVGFDFDRLDALILASDLEEYFIQYLGRVFRREDVKPIIFDLVDNNNVLKKHFSTRKSVYTECGGIIVQYSG
jgi:superfamily II DNA or RNA helicase